MKTLCVVVCVTLFSGSVAAFSQSDVACGQALNAGLSSGATLAIDSRPAGIEIVGTDQEGIRVSCASDDLEIAKDTRLRFSGTADRGKLAITGENFKHGGLQIRIEVPRRTNLGVQMAAGQVKVNEVLGNKEIEIHAGQISISSTHKWNYRNVSASVGIGQVNAEVYGESKGGFFRNFRRENADGEYRLYAHVATGQIDLIGKQSRAADGLE
jgi:hypothetical protein